MMEVKGVNKVPLKALVEDKKLKLREVVAESPEFQALCDSVKRLGVIEPILVRPLKDNRYAVTDGYQRWGAAKAVGLKEIPIITTTAAAEQAILAAFDLNTARIGMTPMVEAKAVARAMEVLGTKKATVIAPKMGKTARWVSVHTELLELPEEIQKALDTGDASVTIGKCHELLRLTPDDRGAFIEPLRRLTEPYFRDHVEKAVASGKAAWVGGSKAPKKAEGKKSPKEQAEKHSKKAEKPEPEKPKEPELEVRSAPALQRGIRKCEKMLTDLRAKREEAEATARKKAKGKKDDVEAAAKKAVDAFDAKNALPMAYLKGEIAFGLYALNLNSDAKSLDAALLDWKKDMKA